jgi:parallel beta-helix repeat protein
VCTPQQVSQAGLRVGISFGCGTTGDQYCRNGRCDYELSDSVIANNVIAHCNDFGIDLYRARRTLVAHNTLINTAGIDARHASTQAVVIGNLLEGRVRARDRAQLDAQDNAVPTRLDSLLTAPDALDLHWHESSDQTRPTPETERDFCGQRRPALSPPGATVQPRCDAGR